MASITHDQHDLWTKFIKGSVHLVEKLCPAIERRLQWDFSDCGSLLSIEEECSKLNAEGWNDPSATQALDHAVSTHVAAGAA